MMAESVFTRLNRALYHALLLKYPGPEMTAVIEILADVIAELDRETHDKGERIKP